jgi:hypothetical protein
VATTTLLHSSLPLLVCRATGSTAALPPGAEESSILLTSHPVTNVTDDAARASPRTTRTGQRVNTPASISTGPPKACKEHGTAEKDAPNIINGSLAHLAESVLTTSNID